LIAILTQYAIVAGKEKLILLPGQNMEYRLRVKAIPVPFKLLKPKITQLIISQKLSQCMLFGWRMIREGDLPVSKQ